MSAPTRAEDRLFDANRPLEVADQGVFSIPGRYVEVDKQTVMIGQMFVQYQIPKTRTASLPRGDDPRRRADRVEFPRHAGRTPRLGRRLRRQRLCRLRRRSVGTRPFGIFGDSYGKTRKPSVANVEQRFTAPSASSFGRRPACTPSGPERATQGDAAFDAFYASQVETIGDEALIEQMNREAGAKLLDRIGPAVLLTHSQAGVIGWSIAGRAAAAGERHSGDRAQRAADPRDRRKGCAGLFRRRRGRASLGRHAREDHSSIRRRRRRANLKLVRQEQADGTGLVRCFRRPSRRGRSRTCAGFPSSSW